MLRGRLRVPESILDIIERLENLIEEIVRTFDPLSVIIAGSLAEGRFVRGLSDLDLLVVLNYPVPEDKRFMLRAIEDVDVEITLISLEELKRAVYDGRDFYVSAVRNGIVVYGKNLNADLNGNLKS